MIEKKIKEVKKGVEGIEAKKIDRCETKRGLVLKRTDFTFTRQVFTVCS